MNTNKTHWFWFGQVDVDQLVVRGVEVRLECKHCALVGHILKEKKANMNIFIKKHIEIEHLINVFIKNNRK